MSVQHAAALSRPKSSGTYPGTFSASPLEAELDPVEKERDPLELCFHV